MNKVIGQLQILLNKSNIKPFLYLRLCSQIALQYSFFDNRSNHSAFAPDAFVATIESGGNAPKMRDIFLVLIMKNKV